MSKPGDEARLIRQRRAADLSDFGRSRREPSSRKPVIIVQPTEEESYPNEPQRVFACFVVTATAVQKEDAEVEIKVDESRFVYVLNLGTAIPPQDEAYIPAYVEDGRLIMFYDGETTDHEY